MRIKIEAGFVALVMALPVLLWLWNNVVTISLTH